MVNKLHITRSISISEDSRTQRFLKLFQAMDLDIRCYDWSDGGHSSKSFKIKRRRSRPILNAVMIPFFNIWLFFSLMFNVRSGDVVFAVDLDTAIPSFLVCKLRRARFVFDVADPFSIGRLGRESGFIHRLERHILTKSCFTIFPSIPRYRLYGVELPYLVIENVPQISPSVGRVSLEKENTSDIVLGYFGSLDPHSRLLELVATTLINLDNRNLKLIIAGTGALSDFFNKLAARYPERIKFLGGFTQEQLAGFMSQVDILLACYASDVLHHKYVAANKEFEHLLYGKPVITNIGTNFSDRVVSLGTGWVFDEFSEGSLEELLNSIVSDYQSCLIKGKLAADIGSKEYRRYWNDSQSVLDLKFKIKELIDG